MAESPNHHITDMDRSVLRRLGERIAEIAVGPEMDERRRLWKKLNALHAERPMVLVEIHPLLDDPNEMASVAPLKCESEWARTVELGLRDKILHHEYLRDDRAFEPRITYQSSLSAADYGVAEVYHHGQSDYGRGSYVWEPPLKNLPEDLGRLHFREFTYHAEATERERARLEWVFGGVLPVVNRNDFWWSLGMTWAAIRLVGLEQFMLAMCDQPEAVRALMAFLRDDHLHMVSWCEEQGLLTLNNEDDYIGSGGCGYTDLLPPQDYVPGRPARARDLWDLSESQETVGVSPEMFAEFILPYQLPVISRFGFACYGCCEPLDRRWHYVKQIPNLRRVSVSPWSDVRLMAQNLGADYVFSRKPNPAYVSSDWDEERIRADLQETVAATRGLNVEIVLKDVHTVRGEPWRLPRWVEIAREVIDRKGR